MSTSLDRRAASHRARCQPLARAARAYCASLPDDSLCRLAQLSTFALTLFRHVGVVDGAEYKARRTSTRSRRKPLPYHGTRLLVPHGALPLAHGALRPPRPGARPLTARPPARRSTFGTRPGRSGSTRCTRPTTTRPTPASCALTSLASRRTRTFRLGTRSSETTAQGYRCGTAGRPAETIRQEDRAFTSLKARQKKSGWGAVCLDVRQPRPPPLSPCSLAVVLAGDLCGQQD